MKKVVRRSISVLLSVLMVISMFAVGIISAGALDVANGATIYFDNSLTKWSNVYLVIGHSTYKECKTMTLAAGSTTKYEYTFNVDWKNATQFYFRDTSVASGSTSVTAGKSGNYTVAATSVPVSSKRLFVPSAASGSNIPGEWVSTGCPTNVLNGSNIMFYVGVDSSWGAPNGVGAHNPTTAKYFLGDTVSGVTAIGGTTVRSDSTAVVTAPGNTAYNGTNNVNGSWEGTSIGTPVGGGAYKIGGTQTSVSPAAISTITADSGDTVAEGTASVTLTAQTNKSQSSVGLPISVEYYINGVLAAKSGTVASNSASATLDTSSYKAGDTITLQSVLTDGNVFWLGPVKTLTVSASGVAVPTNLKVEATPGGNVLKGEGTISSPFEYYYGKTASVTASATAPEGATLEYAFIDSSTTKPTDSDFSTNTDNTFANDTTQAIRKRFVYVRAVIDGEKSEPVSTSYNSRHLEPAAQVTSSFPDGVAQNADFNLTVALSNVYPYSGYGDATVTVKNGETVLGTATAGQAELAANGTASVVVACSGLSELGGNTLTISAQYEGVDSSDTTFEINVFDPNAVTDTINQAAESTLLLVDMSKVSGMFNSSVPYLHVWDDNGHILTSSSDPRTAMTLVPGTANLYYFKPTTAQETAIGTNILHVQLLKTNTWSAAGPRFDITAKTQTLIDTLTASSVTPKNVTPLTLKSITSSSAIRQNVQQPFTVRADGGIPWVMSNYKSTDASYKLTVTAALQGGTTQTIVNAKSFAYTADSAACTFNWTPAEAGSYTLTYTLTDEAGIDTVSYQKQVEVTGIEAPVVTEITPADGSMFSVGESFDVTVAAGTAPDGITYYYEFSGTGVKTEDQAAGTSNTITVEATADMVGKDNAITVKTWAQDAQGNTSAIVENTIHFTVDYTQVQKDYNALNKLVTDNPLTPAMEQYCVKAAWDAYQEQLTQAQALVSGGFPSYTVTENAYAAPLDSMQAAYTELLNTADYPTVDFYAGSQWYHVNNTAAWDRTDVQITELPADYVGPLLAQLTPFEGAALDLGNTTALSDGRQMYMYKITGVPAGAKFILSDTQEFTFPAQADALTAEYGKTYYIYHDGTDNAMVTIDAMSVASVDANPLEVQQGDLVALTATDTVLGNDMTTSVGAAVTHTFSLEDGTALVLNEGKWDTADVTPGSYKIFVTQTDANGLTIKSDKFVTVTVAPRTVYTAPTAVTVAADAETYYDGDSIVITSAASGSTYRLENETEEKAYDTLEGATYTYELYNGAEKIDETTGLAGANVTFTIPAVSDAAEYNLTVKAYPTLSKGSASKISDAIVKTVQPLISWNTSAQAFEMQKDSAAVTEYFANNGAYTLVSSGVTATAHGTDAAVAYRYGITNKADSSSVTPDGGSWTPQAGNYTVTPVAVITYGGQEYTQELTAADITIQANLLSDPALTGSIDGTAVDTAVDGAFDLKNYPEDDAAKGNLTFNASASVTEPADASAAVTYSYTLKEDDAQPAALASTDGSVTFNLRDKCKMGSTYVLTASAQVTTSGITQTTTKTYTFSVTDSGQLVTVFFGGPNSWIDKIKYIVYNDADKTQITGTLLGTFHTNDQTAGLTDVTYDIYMAQVPSGQEFYIANQVVFDEAHVSGSTGLYTAKEGALYYIYGKNSINYAYEVNETTIEDFKISSVNGTAVTETDTVYTELGSTVTFKNILSSQYASYKTPVNVEYYIDGHKIASSGAAASNTVTTDVTLANTPSDPDSFVFEEGKTYQVKAVVTEGNYSIAYAKVVNITVLGPQKPVTSYFLLSKEMMNDQANPWTAEGLKWEALNLAGEVEAMEMGDKPIDVQPDTVVNGIQYDIDGYLFKVTYHSNISKIRFFMDGQGTGNETDGYSKLSTSYLDVLGGKYGEKAYYITDYANYIASPSIAPGVEGWYNLKYTATFQYPKETVRFYQQGASLTKEELSADNSVTKTMELYVSANIEKLYPRVDSRYNEYVWQTSALSRLLENTDTIIPTSVNTRKYSLTLVNTPEEAAGIEVSAGTMNCAPEIRSISGKPIEGSENVPYYIYQEANKLSTQVEYMYGIHIVAPLLSKDKDGNDCDFIGWYDIDKQQYISYQPRFATIITNTHKLMPVYSDNTALNVLQPEAVIDNVTYETYIQGSSDMVKMVFATRVISPPVEDYTNLKLFVQRVVKADSTVPQESEWSAPVELTSQMNKDKRVNVAMKAEMYSGGTLNTNRYFMRAYVEYNDKDGNLQKAYSNIVVASPELMASV